MRTRKLKRSANFSAQQLVWLEREAEKIGISVSDLLRRLVDEKRLSQPESDR